MAVMARRGVKFARHARENSGGGALTQRAAWRGELLLHERRRCHGGGDVLFDPHSGDNFDRDEDHLALMMELLGMMPRKIALGGRYSRDYFNRYGDLRHIRRLRFWPLSKVLVEKYEFSDIDAIAMSDFLVPILDFVPEKRPTAAQLLQHPWFDAGPLRRQPRALADTENDGIPENKGKENGDERDAMAASWVTSP
ncbi:hypothetical protein ZWY2020_017489 [Hordeum vulgare]|nr:hypothetical protein ZWY2020_017489 [Hordeum vulgare]